ncbi:hypothetical protein Tco_0519058 [Tanacetum coccineum]
MHYNIMTAGSRDRPPMLATGRYAQWRSRFLRYIDTRPNGDALRKCILEGPYTPSTIIIPTVPATDNSPVVPERTTVETVVNMSPENKAHFESEKEVIHLILTGIRDEIYSTVDACKTTHNMWEAIERLQQEVNELRAERIAKNANPLARVATAQPYQDPYYQAPKPHKSYAPTIKASLLTKSHGTTRNKGKEIAKPITPPSESATKDSDHEQAQKDMEMQKNLALIAKYFKKIYKPTNNNLRTCSNTRNKNVDTIPRYKNDNQIGQFGNQRTITVTGARETVDTDEEIDEQELEAHYSYMAKIQEVPTAESGTDSEPLEQVQYDAGYNVFVNETHSEQPESTSDTCLVEQDNSNVILDSTDMCDNDIQNDENDVECDDKRVVLANLIANLKLDVDENKKIQKQLKKENTTLAHELTECKSIAETSRTLGESNKLVDQAWVKHSKDHFRAPTAHDMEILIKTCLMPLALKTHNDSFVFVHELKQEMHADLKYVESLEKEIDKLESNKADLSNMYDTLLQECKSAPFSDSFERKHFLKTKLVPKTNVLEGLSKTVTAHNLPQTKRKVVRNTNVIKQGMYRIDTQTTQTRAPQFPQTSRNTNPRVSTSTGVNHRTIVSRPHLKSNKINEKVMPNTSQVKFKKTKVEDHHRISSISNQSKSVTACNDRLKSRTSNVNAVCATCGKCVFNLNDDACVSKYLNDVNARTKKPNVVPISTRKPKSQANKSVATPRKKTVASESTVQNSKSYYRMLYEKTSKAWKWWIEQQCPSGYKWVPKTKMKWVPKVRNENVQKRVSFAIDNASRITNVLKLTNTHMTGNLTLLCNFVEKYLGTVRFGNDQFAPILGYGDLVQGNIMINRVYYVKGLNHNLFSVGQFCDADLEVAFRKSTCFVRDLQGNDLLTGNCGSDLYTISLQETNSSTPICLMAKASPTQAWL